MRIVENHLYPFAVEFNLPLSGNGVNQTNIVKDKRKWKIES